ncbi:hypothetical protein [Pontibacter fetidus]|uniref:Uncharacterized protein n=1 Tax=Pontibacter fetidus TaxID=2700082 RepID=A0A6B2HCB8_9BACT|nr:hypothetical protein [Pontibacter fetidus]NDK57692.1 hypothetical protein [Pontibacter fetidus]
MVTVTDFVKRTSADGNEFNALLLQGEIEMILSKQSGRYYATARTCSITSTFNDLVCQSLIGKQLPGCIEKMECEPYDYRIPNSDEIIKLDYVYYYNPSNKTMEQEVFEVKVAA